MSGSARKTLLLVEDEAVIAMSQQMSLETYGYSVISALSGEEAIAIFTGNPGIDLILMDIDLGKSINGPDTALRMLKIRDIPIVFLSSHTEKEVVEKTEKITSYGYVVKNSGITVLDASIKMAFKLFDANKKIHLSDELFKSFFNSSAVGTAIVSPDGRWLHVNDTLCLMLGYAQDELLHMTWRDITPPEDLEKEMINDQTVLDGKKPSTIEKKYNRKDGTSIDVEISMSIVKNPDGSIAHFSAIFHDITSRKQSEEALREKDSRIRSISNNFTQGMIYQSVMYPDGTRKFTYLSDSVRKLYGITPEEGMADASLIYRRIHKDDIELLQKAENEAFRTLSPFKAEIRIHDPSGEIRWSSLISTPTLQADGSTRWDGIEFIITERKNAEAEIQTKNNELEALNEELTATVEEMEAAYEEMEATNEELTAVNNELNIKEKALRKEKVFIEALLESIPGYLYVYDENGNLIRWNKKHEEMTGYSAEELSHMNMSKWFEGEDAIRVAAAVNEVFTKGYGEVEANLLIKGGGKLLIHSTGVILEIDGKKYFTGVGIDISKQKKTELALHEMQEQYRAIAESSSDYIMRYDRNFRHIYGNRMALKATGMTTDQYTGKTHREMGFPEHLCELWETHLQKVFDTGQPSKMEFDVELADGMQSLDLLFSPEFAPDGTVNSVIGIARDISIRKRMEEETRRSEEQFKNIVRDMQVGVLLQGERAEIFLSNPKALELLGINEDQLLGKTSYDPDWNVIHEDGSPFPGPSHPVPVAIATQKAVRNVIMGVYRPISGDRVWLSVDAVPQYTCDGSFRQIVCTFTDITALKHSEFEIKKLLSEKETILKEVHHHIKNSMNTIRSLLSVQRNTLHDETAVNAFNDTESRVQSMMILYEKLYHTESYQNVPVNKYLPILVQQIISNFPQIPPVTVETTAGDFAVDAGRLQLLGIIVNELLTNIMKYAFVGRKKGHISIHADLADADAAAQKISLVIADDGNGMPESVDFSNSPGFGLMLVGMLTKQIGGTIRIERGSGTKIILEFPA